MASGKVSELFGSGFSGGGAMGGFIAVGLEEAWSVSRVRVLGGGGPMPIDIVGVALELRTTVREREREREKRQTTTIFSFKILIGIWGVTNDGVEL